MVTGQTVRQLATPAAGGSHRKTAGQRAIPALCPRQLGVLPPAPAGTQGAPAARNSSVLRLMTNLVPPLVSVAL